jgi:putrescine aminotransferase
MSPHHTARIETRSTQEWQAADARHFLHPFTDHKALADKGARIIERADNIYLWDSDGHKLLDAMSGLWCVNVGYGQQALVDAATRQMSELPFYNAFFQTATPPAIELAEALAAIAPAGFERVFFCNSGSEANDTIVRMVRRYWDIQGQPQRKKIIGRVNGYHGSTMAGASLGGMAAMHAQGGLPIPDIHHIEQPHWFASGRAMSAPPAGGYSDGPPGGASRSWERPGDRLVSRDEFGLIAAGWLEAKIIELGAENVAAFIGEPVQGAGGVIVPPPSYWPEIERICRRHGVLLVSDEVICGFGRTGSWFGCQTQGFEPDLISFAKGISSGYLPLGGVLVGERVARALVDHGGEFEHGFTYSGHPTACAVALANLRLLRQLKLLGHVQHDVGPYLAAQLAALQQDHPLVGEVQSCGLMGALQLVQDKTSLATFAPELGVGMLCRGHCFGNGLIMRAVGDRMIVAPPLVITRAQIDEMVALIRRCLDLTLAELLERGLMVSRAGAD